MGSKEGNPRTEETAGRSFSLRKKFIRGGAPTETGIRAQRIVLADHALKSHFDPTVNAAMADWLVEREEEIRRDGLTSFGISEDKADKTIQRMAAKLEREGIPYWRVGAFNEKLQTGNQFGAEYVGGGRTSDGIHTTEIGSGRSLGNGEDGGQVGALPTHSHRETGNQ